MKVRSVCDVCSIRKRFTAEKLTGEKLDVPEVTQSEEGQKQKLAVVLSAANRVLGRYPPYKWNVESVHSKNVVAILHLLVGLARLFRAPVRLPERVAVQLVVVRKKDGQLIHRTVREELTTTYDDLGMRCERDAFDTLFDHAPDKLAVVKKVSLAEWHNRCARLSSSATGVSNGSGRNNICSSESLLRVPASLPAHSVPVPGNVREQAPEQSTSGSD